MHGALDCSLLYIKFSNSHIDRASTNIGWLTAGISGRGWNMGWNCCYYNLHALTTGNEQTYIQSVVVGIQTGHSTRCMRKTAGIIHFFLAVFMCSLINKGLDTWINTLLASDNDAICLTFDASWVMIDRCLAWTTNVSFIGFIFKFFIIRLQVHGILPVWSVSLTRRGTAWYHVSTWDIASSLLSIITWWTRITPLSSIALTYIYSCHFSYQFIRSDVASVLTHPAVIATVFSLVLLTATLLLGFIPVLQTVLRLVNLQWMNSFRLVNIMIWDLSLTFLDQSLDQSWLTVIPTYVSWWPWRVGWCRIWWDIKLYHCLAFRIIGTKVQIDSCVHWN